MTVDSEWQDPVFVIELPVGGFIEQVKGSVIYLYRGTQDPDIQEALYAPTPPSGYKIEIEDGTQRWRYVTSS